MRHRTAGYEVAREARRILGPEALLVAVTAYDTPIVREAAQAAGFDYFFVKPVDPNELNHLLQEYGSRMGA